MELLYQEKPKIMIILLYFFLRLLAKPVVKKTHWHLLVHPNLFIIIDSIIVFYFFL